MKFLFKKFLKALNPEPRVGGLDISNSGIRFMLLHDDKSVAASAFVALSAGALVNGRIADDENVARALAELHKQIARSNRAIPIIVSLPAAPVYTQVFSMPLLPPDQLEETARLNIKIASPLPGTSSYSDWQMVGDGPDAGQVEALGAFIESAVADQYMRFFQDAGFLVVALEYAPLSLARVAQNISGLDRETPHIMVSCTADGILFLILRNGNPYFVRFIEQSAAVHFQSVVGNELRRVLHFYASRWGSSLQKALVVNTVSNKEIAAWIKKDFNLEVLELVGYQDRDQTWLLAVGAALRGLIPRADDRFISLSRVGTEDALIQNRVWRFVSVWRNSILTILASALFVYLMVDFALIGVARRAQETARQAGGGAATDEITALQAEAKKFNTLVDITALAQGQARGWTDIVRTIYNTAGNQIILTQIRLEGTDKTIVIIGTALSEQGIIAFKNELIKAVPGARVSLPLSAISAIPGGRASFTATLAF